MTSLPVDNETYIGAKEHQIATTTHKFEKFF